MRATCFDLISHHHWDYPKQFLCTRHASLGVRPVSYCMSSLYVCYTTTVHVQQATLLFHHRIWSTTSSKFFVTSTLQHHTISFTRGSKHDTEPCLCKSHTSTLKNGCFIFSKWHCFNVTYSSPEKSPVTPEDGIILAGFALFCTLFPVVNTRTTEMGHANLRVRPPLLHPTNSFVACIYFQFKSDKTQPKMLRNSKDNTLQ